MSNSENRQSKIRVGLVDDHPVVREGLRSFLQLAQDIEVIAEAGSVEEALEMARSIPLDVILMDLVLQGNEDGITATRLITQEHPEICILALTSFQDTDRMMHVLEAGAISYLQKDVSPDHLLNAIRQTASGRTVLEPTALSELRKLAQPSDKPLFAAPRSKQTKRKGGYYIGQEGTERALIEPLTVREHEVLDGLAQGLSNKEIGAELGIAEKTVKVHVSHILAKLNVYDRTQALLKAAKLGLIELRF